MNNSKHEPDNKDKELENRLYKLGEESEKFEFSKEKEDQIFNDLVKRIRESKEEQKTGFFRFREFFGWSYGFKFSPQFSLALVVIIGLTAGLFFLLNQQGHEIADIVKPKQDTTQNLQKEPFKDFADSTESNLNKISKTSKRTLLETINIKSVQQDNHVFGAAPSKTNYFSSLDSILKINDIKIKELKDNIIKTEWMFGIYNNSNVNARLIFKMNPKINNQIQVFIDIDTNVKTKSNQNLNQKIKTVLEEIKK